MWAVKFLDVTPEADIHHRLTAFPGTGIEVGVYDGFGFSPETVARIQSRPEFEKMFHLPHRSVSLAHCCMQTMRYNVHQLELLGMRRAILHGQILGDRPTLTPKEAADQMTLLSARFPGVVFMLENTWESLSWWACYLALRPPGGMVLDLGHALALSESPARLPDWIDLLIEAHVGGRPIHCHVHCNDGSADLHECLAVGAAKGWLAPSAWAPYGWLPELQRLARLPCLKTLEVNGSALPATLAWLEDQGL